MCPSSVSACAPGYYSNNEGDSCEICPMGTYRRFVDFIGHCVNCPVGTTTTAKGQTSSAACGEQKYYKTKLNVTKQPAINTSTVDAVLFL